MTLENSALIFEDAQDLAQCLPVLIKHNIRIMYFGDYPSMDSYYEYDNCVVSADEECIEIELFSAENDLIDTIIIDMEDINLDCFSFKEDDI